MGHTVKAYKHWLKAQEHPGHRTIVVPSEDTRIKVPFNQINNTRITAAIHKHKKETADGWSIDALD